IETAAGRGRGGCRQQIDQVITEAELDQRDPLVHVIERASEYLHVEALRARLVRHAQHHVIEAERLEHRPIVLPPATIGTSFAGTPRHQVSTNRDIDTTDAAARLPGAMIRRDVRGLRGEVGIALPLTLIALLMLSALTIALAVLAQSEPVIAANQQRGAVARALAESAVERAVWALGVGAAVPGGVDPPGDGAVAVPPYDGRTYITLGHGGLTLKVPGVSTTQAPVQAVGWTPDHASPGNAHRKITASLMRFPSFGRAAPCALCVNGDLEISGSASVDARSDTSCGRKYGAYTTGATSIRDAASVRGAVDG